MMIRTRNGYKSQMFQFDWKSKTIKSVYHKTWSLDIDNQGNQGRFKTKEKTNMFADTTRSSET